MPYVSSKDRKIYQEILNKINETPTIITKGDLEFLIFTLMKKYMASREYRYSTLHDCTYACIHAGEEFKRRYLDVRENEAMNTNGDI